MGFFVSVMFRFGNSVRGYSRMAGINASNISRGVSKRLKKEPTFSELKQAQIPTPGGLQGANLIPENLIAEWIVTDNPELATNSVPFR